MNKSANILLILIIPVFAILSSCGDSNKQISDLTPDEIFNFSQQTQYLYSYRYESVDRIDTLSFITEKDSLGKHIYLMKYSIPTYDPEYFCLAFEDNQILLHGRILEPFMKISCTDFDPDWHILADFSNQEWNESYTKNAKANIIHESKVVNINVKRDIIINSYRVINPPNELMNYKTDDFHCIINVERTESIPDSVAFTFPNGLKERSLNPISFQISFRKEFGLITTKQDKYERILVFE